MTKQQQVTGLWRQCFNDTEEFISFYFGHKYSDANALIHEEDGQAMAALQMLPYPMSWEGSEIMTSYISGACTLPAARNKGIMARLLTEAFHLMRQRRIAMSILIPAEPWLYDYYAKFGYVSVFDHTIEHIQLQPAPLPGTLQATSPASFGEAPLSRLYPYFDSQMRLRGYTIQHTFADFTAIVQDLYMSGGRLVILHEGDLAGPSGLAFTLPGDGHIWASDMLYHSTDAEQTLLLAIAAIWGKTTLSRTIAPGHGKTSRMGMARVTDPAQMLQHYAATHPGQSFSIGLTDTQMPENNGIYLLDKGICTLYAGKHPDIHLDTDIPTLTQALLGYRLETLPAAFSSLFTPHHPYMSLMLN